MIDWLCLKIFVNHFFVLLIVLPRVYDTSLRDNIFEQRAESIAKQLLGDDMVLGLLELNVERIYQSLTN
jgi:hypothetical protein